MPPGTSVDVTMVDALLHGPCGLSAVRITTLLSVSM
jgi:hypothetical protein